jgi:hypothetical protein
MSANNASVYSPARVRSAAVAASTPVPRPFSWTERRSMTLAAVHATGAPAPTRVIASASSASSRIRTSPRAASTTVSPHARVAYGSPSGVTVASRRPQPVSRNALVSASNTGLGTPSALG